MRVPSRALAAAAIVLGALAACRSEESFRVAEPGPDPVYDLFSGTEQWLYAEALTDEREGRLEPAHALLLALRGSRPRNLLVGSALQEVELQLAALESPDEGPALLRRRYRVEAEARQTPEALVLAARLEDDPPAALLLLERASELDPACAWAHYGTAHVLARMGRWKDAEEAVRRALEADSGHLGALRLHARLLAQAGRTADAIVALEAWLRFTADPRYADAGVDPRARAEARLDLALLYLNDGAGEAALEELQALRDAAGVEVDAVRLLTALAAVLEGLQEEAVAMRAAEEARALDPAALLPAVQQALLYERWFDDPERALKTWLEVLELARAEDDIGALLQEARAQVHVSRLDRAAAEEESEDSP